MLQDKNTNKNLNDEQLTEINNVMANRLLILNIVAGIIFILLSYYLLKNKNYTLSNNTYSFLITISFTLFFLAYHYYTEKYTILEINEI